MKLQEIHNELQKRDNLIILNKKLLFLKVAGVVGNRKWDITIGNWEPNELQVERKGMPNLHHPHVPLEVMDLFPT